MPETLAVPFINDQTNIFQLAGKLGHNDGPLANEPVRSKESKGVYLHNPDQKHAVFKGADRAEKIQNGYDKVKQALVNTTLNNNILDLPGIETLLANNSTTTQIGKHDVHVISSQQLLTIAAQAREALVALNDYETVTLGASGVSRPDSPHQYHYLEGPNAHQNQEPETEAYQLLSDATEGKGHVTGGSTHQTLGAERDDYHHLNRQISTGNQASSPNSPKAGGSSEPLYEFGPAEYSHLNEKHSDTARVSQWLDANEGDLQSFEDFGVPFASGRDHAGSEANRPGFTQPQADLSTSPAERQDRSPSPGAGQNFNGTTEVPRSVAAALLFFQNQ